MKKFLFIFLTVASFIFIIHTEFSKTEAALCENLLRLHVVANSDSNADQELKLKVRDAIIKDCSFLFNEETDAFKAKKLVSENLEKIRECALSEVKKQGFQYDVRVRLCKEEFPTKEYGELILPKGSYEALLVEIGSGKGQNWWCVLFPPLCFVNETCVSVSEESVEAFADGIGEDNKDFVTKEKSPKVELKFKAYEMWQYGKKRIAALF